MKHYSISIFTAIVFTFLHSASAAQVTDKDGHSYKTVNIASKTWMAENLAVGRFNSGVAIPQAKTAEEWEAAYNNAKPIWCYVNFDPATEKTYGRLYNFHAVKDARKLAPAGWHVATDEEWKNLLDVLGEDATTKLKNTQGWDKSEFGKNGTNETGFSAMPAGAIMSWGKFVSTGHYANFWSGTAFEGRSSGWAYNFDSGNTVPIYRDGYASAGNGLSVRCVKD